MSNPVMTQVAGEIDKYTPAAPNYYQAPSNQAPVPGQGTYTQNPYTQTPAGQQYYQSVAEPAQPIQPAQPMPAANRITMEDVITKTGIMFVALLVAAGIAWIMGAQSFGLASAMVGIGAIVGLVLALINSFKREPSAPLTIGYSLAEGMFLGALSMMLEYIYPGIVIQAVIGTFAVFATTLALYATGKVTYSSWMMKTVLIGLVGLIIYSVVSMLLVFTGVISNPFGLDGITILGVPLGAIVGVIAVFLGAVALISDFEVAKQAVSAGVPEKYAWRVAFGIMVTLVWLYTEILRLLQIIRAFSD
ncbi:MAG: Bax inhibitor-1/YccA family protein [Varibaculum sp.]|nr:Bax inhibitor-1/YccA family protein [Varibaculum sp.]